MILHDKLFYAKMKKIRSGYLFNDKLHDEYNCIHMISGGSLIAYNQLNYFKNINSDKFIFDSGPFFPSPYESARFMCNYIPLLNQNHVYKLEKVLSGEALDELIDALIVEDRMLKLAPND